MLVRLIYGVRAAEGLRPRLATLTHLRWDFLLAERNVISFLRQTHSAKEKRSQSTPEIFIMFKEDVMK